MNRSVKHPVFERVALDVKHELLTGRIPDDLGFGDNEFKALWNLHPAERPEIFLHGRRVRIPRYQKAYGHDYHFSGQTSRAEPIPELLRPLHEWARQSIEPRLNGLLLNWYDGAEGHYIGAHRDSTKDMVPGTPIVTISLGAERTFRLRPYKASGYHDIRAENGSVIIIPFDTNLHFTHEVPHFKRNTGRRISVTLRAFETDH